MTIVQSYAPTNEYNDEVKAEFYENLQSVLNGIPQHDIKLILGDMNAKVGSNRNGYEKVMGPQGIGERNENGDRLLQFCAINNLCIGATLFKHRDIHKLTWKSPDGRTKNQIDHIMINNMWRRSLTDVRVYRGAEVDSDHYLVMAKVKVKLRSAKQRRKQEKKIDLNRLKKEEIQEQYTVEINNRFAALQNPNNTTAQEDWENFRINTMEAAKETIGFVNRDRKKWISDTTWSLIEERRQAKSAMEGDEGSDIKKQTYKDINKKVKCSARRDRRKWNHEKLEEIEHAAQKKDSRKVFSTVRELCCESKPASNLVKDKQGNILKTENEQIRRWAEHFQEVLNRPEPTVNFDDIGQIEMEELDVDLSPPREDEIQMAVKKLKNGKSAGNDQISAELIKYGGGAMVKWLQQICEKIWKEEKHPSDWKRGIITKIPKKGDLLDCNNWRGVTLLSVPGKVFLAFFLQRLKNAVDKRLRDMQAGFRPQRSCSDQIFTLRILIEKAVDRQINTIINFIYFEKAFDSLHRLSLWKILRQYGIPGKFVRLIEELYEGNECCVRVDSTESQWFPIKTGVRQGCILSPLLFCIGIDWLMRTSVDKETNGVKINRNTWLDDLDFADDIALISPTKEDMQQKFGLL